VNQNKLPFTLCILFIKLITKGWAWRRVPERKGGAMQHRHSTRRVTRGTLWVATTQTSSSKVVAEQRACKQGEKGLKSLKSSPAPPPPVGYTRTISKLKTRSTYPACVKKPPSYRPDQTCDPTEQGWGSLSSEGRLCKGGANTSWYHGKGKWAKKPLPNT